jgi:cystathionine beta-lyase/cystathionine gamma-synthase
MPESDPSRPETRCVRPLTWPTSTTEPLVPPLQTSAVYRVAGLDQIDALYEGHESGFIYARDGHANAAALAERLAELEGGEAALVCASGMAAESAAALTLLESGAHVALSDSLYGRTTTLVARELARFGVNSSPFDAADADSLRAIITPATRLVVVETISNPLLRVADLDELAAAAGTVPLLVDNTLAPLICRPLDHGAAMVVHSLTKLIGGHSDLIQGVLVGPRPLISRASAVASTFGLTGNPFESWLCARGLATLGVRSERACANALAVAERLARHPGVRAVHYPGLSHHPDHLHARRLLTGGFGTIVTIDLGDRHRANAFIRSAREIPFAPSLGDVATTLSHPATTSHRGQPAEALDRLGIHPGLIRLSIGIEALDDLSRAIVEAIP